MNVGRFVLVLLSFWPALALAQDDHSHMLTAEQKKQASERVKLSGNQQNVFGTWRSPKRKATSFNLAA